MRKIGITALLLALTLGYAHLVHVVDLEQSAEATRMRNRRMNAHGNTSSNPARSFSPDGTNDFIEVADSANFDGVLGANSGCVWVRETTLQTNDRFISKDNSAVTQQEWAFRLNNTQQTRPQFCVMSTLTEALCTNECTTTSNQLANGTAAFVCWTYNGLGVTNDDKVDIYVNGTSVAITCSGTIPAAYLNGTAGVHIGAASNGTSAFGAGFMDEATYWSATLTATDISNLCCGSGSCGGVCSQASAGAMDSHGISGLQLYLKIDGDAYPTATDAAGGDNNGTYTNCTDAASCISSTIP
jgi:hypothetical protein